MDRRVTLFVSRSVQRCGYRAKVITMAKALGMTGNVQNLKDGRVKIVGEGEEEDLRRFIEAVNVQDVIINVTGIESDYSDATGEYDDFYKLVGEGETDERLDKASELLTEIIEVNRDGFSSLGSKMDTMLTKQDSMLEKQDATISVIREEGEKTRTELGAIVKEESQKTRETVSTESQNTREDLSTVMKEEGEKTRTELSSAIKDEGDKTRREHIKTRELSHEIFYSEVQVLREKIRKLSQTVEKIKEKVGIS